MSFANHNILDIALSIIPSTVVQIRKNQGTVVNKYGQVEASYSEWIDVYGIVQPGAERNQHIQGVDISQKRVTIWLRGVALDGTHIQWAPDQIRYVGAIYNVIDVKDWFPYDNYRECECVEAMNLAPNQRSIALDTSKSPIKKKNKPNNKQQTLSFDVPPIQKKDIQEENKKMSSTPIIDAPIPNNKNEIIHLNKSPSLDKKARIRF